MFAFCCSPVASRLESLHAAMAVETGGDVTTSTLGGAAWLGQNAVRIQKDELREGFLRASLVEEERAAASDSASGARVRSSILCVAGAPTADQEDGSECELVGFVRAKMAMAVIRANTLLLPGTWLKWPKWIPFVNGAVLEGLLPWAARAVRGPCPLDGMTDAN